MKEVEILEIVELEKKYFYEIKKIIRSQEFITKLKDIKYSIEKNYKKLKKYWQKKIRV